jgi:thioredoxin 1
MIELNKENFESEVLNAEGTVLVDFWSPSCEPCKALMPHVHEYEEVYGDKIKFTSLDITVARRVAIGQKVL